MMRTMTMAMTTMPMIRHFRLLYQGPFDPVSLAWGSVRMWWD
jgi:hypothetical protein